jgi:glycine dehydrogenase subunit 1
LPISGHLDLADLNNKISAKTSAVYFENPGYLGQFESQSAEIARIARMHNAETIVGVDPLSLGAVVPPSSYGADIVVGTLQTLGVHMNAGGGVAGFIATRDEEKYALQYPTLQVSLTDTVVTGERAFGLTLFSQSSYGSRERGNDWTGNGVYLWAIASAVYMSLLGPSGFREIGSDILRRSHYAAKRISAIPGLKVLWPSGFFKEFVINFDGVSVDLEEIDKRLRENGIFGGKILTGDFPQLGKSALYCVTEVHTQSDIDRLVSTLEKVTK